MVKSKHVGGFCLDEGQSAVSLLDDEMAVIGLGISKGRDKEKGSSEAVSRQASKPHAGLGRYLGVRSR